MYVLHLTTTVRAAICGALLAAGLVNPSSVSAQSMFAVPWKKQDVAKPASKPSFAFRTSEIFLGGATAFDMTTTVRSMDHPTTAYRSDGTFLTHYYVNEAGWAGAFGRRDEFSVVIANSLLSVGVERVSRNFYARGGRWRLLSYGLLLGKGLSNGFAGSSNIRLDGRIDNQVRLTTGYRGRIIWSR